MCSRSYQSWHRLADQRLTVVDEPIEGIRPHSRGEPKDIALLVLFLASPHASAMTGQSIAVDGGSTPGIRY